MTCAALWREWKTTAGVLTDLERLADRTYEPFWTRTHT